MSNLNLHKLREWVWPWPWTFKHHCRPTGFFLWYKNLPIENALRGL